MKYIFYLIILLSSYCKAMDPDICLNFSKLKFIINAQFQINPKHQFPDSEIRYITVTVYRLNNRFLLFLGKNPEGYASYLDITLTSNTYGNLYSNAGIPCGKNTIENMDFFYEYYQISEDFFTSLYALSNT